MSEFADSNWSVVNNVWIKQMVFRKKGWIAQTHAHTFDHQTLVTSGRLRVTMGESVQEFTAPAIVVIVAGMPHRLEAMEDHTIAFCIHALRDGETVVDGVQNDHLQSLA